MLPDERPARVADGPRRRRQTLSFQEGPIVVAGEEARVLTLPALRRGEPGGTRLATGLLLRLLTEREPQARDESRIDLAEHVGLILVGVRRPGQEVLPAVLDRPRVVTGREPTGTDSPCEGKQLAEAETPRCS